MSWPGWLTSRLAQGSPYDWIYSVRRELWLDGLDQGWSICAPEVPIPYHEPGLAGWSTPAYKVDVRSWQGDSEGFTVRLTDRAAFDRALARLQPGSVLGLYVGARGIAPQQHACVSRGVVLGYSCEPERGQYAIVCAPLLAAFRNRPAVADIVNLFANADATSSVTTVAASFTGGVSSTLQVGNASVLERDVDGYGAVVCNPAGPDTFTLIYQGVSGNTLQNVSSTGKFGTTIDNLSIGNGVRNVAYLRGNPLTIILRLLLSTGTADPSTGTPGKHGLYDAYPESWGFGLPPSMVDIEGIEALRRTVVIVDSGNHFWEILVSEPVNNGLEWLVPLMREGGLFFTERQGKLSVGAAQDPTAPLRITDLPLSDRDGHNFRWQPTSASKSSTVFSMAAYYVPHSGAGALQSANILARNSVGDIRGQPVFLRQDLSTLAQAIHDSNYVNTTANILRRVGPWSLRPVSELRYQHADLRPAILGCGSVVPFSSPILKTALPSQAANGGRLWNTEGLITEHAINWFTGSVDLGLAFLPANIPETLA